MISPEQNAQIDFTPSNFLGSLFLVVKTVLLSPGFFYEKMKTEGGLRNPLIFLICCVLIHTLIVSLFVAKPTIIIFNLINGILMPFVTAGILFFIITRLFKASGTYELSLRVNAYAAATALFSWIPVIGLLLQLYRFYLIALGLSRTFSIKLSQSFLAIAITVVIYIVTLGPIMSYILGGQPPPPVP
ncbi:MAG: YIP1 family protein [Desulfobacterales bacterium]|nr:YIP1 family protein [Desulfobacterales bacterium]